MELFDENSNFDFSEGYVDFPFAGDIETSYLKIEKLIDEHNLKQTKLNVLKNIMDVIDLLTGLGNGYEELLLDTAQLYILSKLTKIDLNSANKYFDKYAIEGAKILSNKILDKNEYIESVFENKEYRYLGKIKIADYIFELKEFGKNKLKSLDKFDEIKLVVSKYENKSQKDLMKKLKEMVG